MHLSIQCIHSVSAGDFTAQLHSCLVQINTMSDKDQTKRRIVKLTVFTSCIDNEDYLLKMNLLTNILIQCDYSQAPASLINQAAIESETAIEVWILEYVENETIFTFRCNVQSSFLRIDTTNFSCLISNQFSAKQNNFQENGQETFKLLDAILCEQGFEYKEIVRQWNYIENITMLDTVTEKTLQNYQIFNDLRTIHYEKSDFSNGYPSATGIGIANGGCCVEVIALKEKNGNTVFPITNSLQVDAHNYSENVLVGNAIAEIKKVSTPKFERGKSIQLNGNGLIFISGTASIVGEQTVFQDYVTKQTFTTIQNIEHLISVNNLIKNKISVASEPKLISYRVYLKNESDYPEVKSLCDAHFGEKNAIFVKADICRANLLVEIEANYCI